MFVGFESKKARKTTSLCLCILATTYTREDCLPAIAVYIERERQKAGREKSSNTLLWDRARCVCGIQRCSKDIHRASISTLRSSSPATTGCVCVCGRSTLHTAILILRETLSLSAVYSNSVLALQRYSVLLYYIAILSFGDDCASKDIYGSLFFNKLRLVVNFCVLLHYV